MPSTIKYGSKGDWVKVLQYVIGASADGKFGTKTKSMLKEYQKKNGLTADGIAGNKTWAKIEDNAPTIRKGDSGAYVFVLEVLLETMKEDGVYSDDEFDHVKTYQTAKKLDADGIVGKKTWAALFGSSSEYSSSASVSSGKFVQPKDYKQYDSRWGSILYTSTGNKKQTIKSSGCGPTAMADIVYTMKDSSVTPPVLAEYSVKRGHRSSSGGTAWSFFKDIAEKYSFSKFVQTTSFSTMQGCLETGGYVVVSFRKSKWTNGG